MDKHAINKFAVQARRDLIASTAQRLALLGITQAGASEKEARSTASAEFYAGNEQPLEGRDILRRADLVKRLNEMAAKSDWKTAYQDLVEEVAYTWFNRIIAIRFMEINDYLPTGVRVLSSIENRNEPDIMHDALDLEDELGGYRPEELALIQKAQELQQPNDLDAMYQMLFVKQVNKLNESLPKLFEKTDDFMLLLFTPSYNRGVIADLVKEIPEADFDIASDDSQGQVEIIGWLYQYYNQEPKDAAFKKRNYSQADIPAVTQLFTPDWIVKYLVENSVGRIWIDHLQAIGDKRTDRDLAQSFSWHYYMSNATQPDDVRLQVHSQNKSLAKLTAQDITVVDPSMGSGHILIYAFDVLMQIYVTEGYSQREAARQILVHNLFGADIDTRAFQLAYFAMMMKGRQFDRRILRSDINPHVIDIPEVSWTQDDLNLMSTDPDILSRLESVSSLFRHGNELGSLISIDSATSVITMLHRLVEGDLSGEQLTLESSRRDTLITQLAAVIKTLEMLCHKYLIGITNPPYMGSGKMPSNLAEFVKKHYQNSKSDLFAVFMERLREFTIDNGYYAMITQHQWMFLSSFESLRKSLSQQTFINLAHLGTRAFEEIGGEVVQSVSFVMRNSAINNFVGTYERLVDFDSQSKKESAYLKAVNQPDVKYLYRANQANFQKVPDGPLAYWLKQTTFDALISNPRIIQNWKSAGRLKTHDNNRFLRLWWEIVISSRWRIAADGGPFRRWYGNNNVRVDFNRHARELYNAKGGLPELSLTEKTGITWNLITSGTNTFRIKPEGQLYTSAAPTIVELKESPENRLLSLLAQLNSSATAYLLKAFNPTLNTTIHDVTNLPILRSESLTNNLAKSNIILSKTDWCLLETSAEFSSQPLMLHIAEHNRNWTIKAAFTQWATEAEDRFNQLKANEEELNRIFIDLYGLQDELTPEVADKDVSVRKADLSRDIKAFLSYFIGVVFGRYSLDVPGLAFAGGDWDPNKYQSFKPNSDDVILLTDEDYFNDERDIINRLKEFLTVTFGAEKLDENLRFIASALGKKGDTPEAQIRKYFLDDFYKKDHLSTYQKRPIYWQLSSGKQGGFRALMYLHRYDENTFAMVRTSYLHPLQEAYGNRRTQLQKMIEVETNTKQRNLMTKQVVKLDKQLDEIAKFDSSLQHVANMHIALDLDDGVLVNHEKVQGGQKLLDPLK
ncbi:BREX-1 system adenine-specific DNA-methyltransferase PglX [Lacticaseibacillus sp. GG6-2]